MTQKTAAHVAIPVIYQLLEFVTSSNLHASWFRSTNLEVPLGIVTVTAFVILTG